MPSNSSKAKRPRKTANRPEKPYADFPLYPHPSGHWAKKIRGKLHYFGRWGRKQNGSMERVDGDGWQAALDLYQEQRDDLHAGRTPRTTGDGLTVADLCNRYLTAKTRKVEAGELAPRSFQELKQTTDRIVAAFGKRRLVDDLAADDFESLRATAAKRWGPTRLANEITRVRGVFKFGVENGLIEKTVRFGSEFRKPSKATMRKHKATTGKLLFSREQVRALLDAAGVQMKAAILLGINAGLGNADISGLQMEHLDLKAGWLDYPRVKTGVPRRAPLWPETTTALKAAIKERPEPTCDDDAGCVFLTPAGRFVRINDKARTDYLAHAFPKLMRGEKITGRKGLGFYSLRHTLATVGLEAKDRGALKGIMGHTEHDMLSAYDEAGPSDDRLRAVTDHVRKWLFPRSRKRK